ncbi:SGS domain-domain-containing protein [Naematelia encephala]|uniref:SGS domain-domain-containing protein n=1 Tax=Naematelia encephala TaxID=71784 RepID=A0A1Y2ALD5_9TREE|nr:SGS domain-domain-containing protein [Naematelia encephala]
MIFLNFSQTSTLTVLARSRITDKSRIFSFSVSVTTFSSLDLESLDIDQMSASITDAPLPRYDFYQTPVHLIVSLYVKGYNTPELSEVVEVSFKSHSVEIFLPPLPGSSAVVKTRLNLSPLFAPIQPEESTFRLLSTKIELKLIKVDTETWPALLSTPTVPSDAGPSRSTQLPPTAQAPVVQEKKDAKRRNWDKILSEDELEDKSDSSDPNAGGDAALQSLFSKIYADADADTRRAMIKSFTESGGTALSTDWSDVGSKTVPIRPPDGMEAKKY